MKKSILVFIFSFLFCYGSFAFKNEHLNRGWNELIKDNDLQALNYFASALSEAQAEKDTETIALAYLHLGITSYSSAYSEGMRYALAAFREYEKFDQINPQKAEEGKAKCRQLVATIKFRQNKSEEAITLCKNVLTVFSGGDSAGYCGLAYSLLSKIYNQQKERDSAIYFADLALKEFQQTNNTTYLPGAMASVAQFKIATGESEKSRSLLEEALRLADSTFNRQAKVLVLCTLSDWFISVEKNYNRAEEELQQALTIAEGLTDRSYIIRVLNAYSLLKERRKEFDQALTMQKRIGLITDSMVVWENEKLQAAYEVEFHLKQKESELAIAKQEKQISTLTSYLLAITLGLILIISAIIIFFIKRNHRRDKLLLQTKEALILSIEEKRLLNERQLQNELEFRESQLTAISLRMKEKNEIMVELKDKINTEKGLDLNSPLSKIINKDTSREKDWEDFNKQFESMNRNFYNRLKEQFPEISPNDLRICALIKLNLSTKEMAAILNISPDSVKTARYRLRKKLKLSTEENLTEFIMQL